MTDTPETENRDAGNAAPPGNPVQEELNLYTPGTVGHALAHAGTRLAGRAKGDFLENLFLEIARKDPNLDVVSAELWGDWAAANSNLDLQGQDLGTDAVAELRNGDRIAVQCKFWEEGQTIPLRELNSFLSDLNRKGLGNEPLFQGGWIFTPNELAPNALTRIHAAHIPVRHLSPMRWAGMKYHNGEIRLPDRELKEHQEKAVAAVCSKLPSERRGKLVMACGSGKTFTALRIAERLRDEGRIDGRVLVCVPSITLASQFREEWMRQARKPMDALVVCSDRGAGGRNDTAKDTSGLERQALREMACRVTTDAREIAKFLKAHVGDGLRVLFSTYQSLPKVQDALKDHRIPGFGLAVADEAHRTTGVTNANAQTPYMLVHDGDAIRAEMRLYMTATPRVYGNIAALQGQGHKPIDMNDHTIFGPVLHRFWFREAVEAGVLADFRVIALGVHVDALPPGIIEQIRDVFTGGKNEPANEEAARVYGTILALRGNAEVFADDDDPQVPTGVLHRTIAFANTIERSKFYNEWINSPEMYSSVRESEDRLRALRERARGRTEEAPRIEISCAHMDAGSGSASRRVALAKLGAAKRDRKIRVLTNVGLFGEGVDVPALNAVAFLDPRRAPIDVVQAVGRAMRRPPDAEEREEKRFGYVIVPIVMPRGTSLKQMAESGDERFRPLLDVLRALQDHDPGLADSLESRLSLQEAPGKPRDPVDPDGPHHIDPDPQGVLDLADEGVRQGIYAQIARHSGLTKADLGMATAAGILSRIKAEADRIGAGDQLAEGLADLLQIGAKDQEAGLREACVQAALQMFNAMLAHSRMDMSFLPGVPSLEQAMTVRPEEDVPGEARAVALDRAWQQILERDYRPIFSPALDVLTEIRKWPALCNEVLSGLADCAAEHGPRIAETGWDHAGPLFHRALATAQGTGAYYTENVSALMLARLAVHDQMADWTDPESVAKLRIMDPACGTGTLLAAALHELKRRVREAAPDADMDWLHRRLVEDSLCGLDINRTATQLAASNLTLSAKRIDYDRMNLHVMPLSAPPRQGGRCGSLELLAARGKDEAQQLLFQDDRSLAGVRAERSVSAGGEGRTDFPCRDLDMVIMNPPYSRAAVRYEHLDPDERERLKNRESEIQEIAVSRDPSLDGVAGYNSIRSFFTPLADMLARRGGARWPPLHRSQRGRELLAFPRGNGSPPTGMSNGL